MIGGESIGCCRFRGSGPKLFTSALEDAVRRPEAMRQWYLSVIHPLAQSTAVETASVRGLWWREIDSPSDLDDARAGLAVEPARAAR